MLSTRDLLLTAGPFVALAASLLVAAYFVLQPNPPRKVVLATGPEQSDYAAYGERYATFLRKFGIEVELRTTEGSSENRRLLLDATEKVDIAFVRGGAGEALRRAQEKENSVPLVSLGSLFYEPIWIFYREEAGRRLAGARLEKLDQMRGWKVATTTRGSGASGLINRLLQANGLDADVIPLERLDLTSGAIGLISGRLDAMALVSSPESPILQMLLRTPGIRLFEFTQADAYSHRFGYLQPVVLSRGVADLAADVPSRSVNLVAPATMLIAREDTHPALVHLFVQAAAEIHGGAGWFSRPGQFPSALNNEVPLAPAAERFFKNGPPLLQRYLPFWMANLIDRMWVALISIIAILIPLSRVVPPLYAFRVRSRIFRWYRQLRSIEDRMVGKDAALGELAEELEALETKVEHVAVPLSYTYELYSLRTHIDLVRSRLRNLSRQ